MSEDACQTQEGSLEAQMTASQHTTFPKCTYFQVHKHLEDSALATQEPALTEHTAQEVEGSSPGPKMNAVCETPRSPEMPVTEVL